MAWGLGPRAPHTCLSSSSSHVPFALSASWLICGSLSRYWSQIKGTVSVVSTASWSILNGAGSCGLGSFLPAPRGSRSSSLWIRGLPWWLRGDESTASAGDAGSVPGSERCRGEGKRVPRRRKAGPPEKEVHPLQYSCLGNLMDRGAWWAAVRGVTKSQTRLSVESTEHA